MRVLVRRQVVAMLGVALSLLAGPRSWAEDYEIGPGDTLEVMVLAHTEMSGDFRVDSEGLITFPILGKIKAAGHTPGDLARKLTPLLADGYLKRPQLTVGVKEYGSQKIYVTGEVSKPGSYPLKADRSLLAFLGDVGPLAATAGHEVVVIRPPAGGGPPPLVSGADPATSGGLPFDVSGSEVFHISIQELQIGNQERNILLQAGDTLYVPRASQVYVTGSVARPGPYRYQEAMTVLQVITLAGGVTERGSSGRIKIVRVTAGKKEEIKAKLTDLVLPEDTLVVPERFF
jgi:polysaccharide export outer membrane protein